jgi:hypothetical protein
MSWNAPGTSRVAGSGQSAVGLNFFGSGIGSQLWQTFRKLLHTPLVTLTLGCTTER